MFRKENKIKVFLQYRQKTSIMAATALPKN